MSIGCRNCGGETRFIFKGKILFGTKNYYECEICEYIQIEDPLWLEKAYDSPLNRSDTGLMQRNLINRYIVLATLLVLGETRGAVVDAAGGVGILVRLLRDLGVQAYWLDKYCQNLIAAGFGFEENQENIGEIALVTAFEAMEHFINPSNEIEKLFALSPNLLFSTELASKPAPNHREWYYYGREHGQHIGFFRPKTLLWLAEKHNKFLLTNGHNYHLFTEKRVSYFQWRMLIKLRSLLPLYSRIALVSLTHIDHDKFVSKMSC